jgi:hypothetical protein
LSSLFEAAGHKAVFRGYAHGKGTEPQGRNGPVVPLKLDASLLVNEPAVAAIIQVLGEQQRALFGGQHLVSSQRAIPLGQIEHRREDLPGAERKRHVGVAKRRVCGHRLERFGL